MRRIYVYGEGRTPTSLPPPCAFSCYHENYRAVYFPYDSVRPSNIIKKYRRAVAAIKRRYGPDSLKIKFRLKSFEYRIRSRAITVVDGGIGVNNFTEIQSAHVIRPYGMTSRADPLQPLSPFSVLHRIDFELVPKCPPVERVGWKQTWMCRTRIIIITIGHKSTSSSFPDPITYNPQSFYRKTIIYRSFGWLIAISCEGGSFFLPYFIIFFF